MAFHVSNIELSAIVRNLIDLRTRLKKKNDIYVLTY